VRKEKKKEKERRWASIPHRRVFLATPRRAHHLSTTTPASCSSFRCCVSAVQSRSIPTASLLLLCHCRCLIRAQLLRAQIKSTPSILAGRHSPSLPCAVAAPPRSRLPSPVSLSCPDR
jgi:hypothetical protein